MFDILVFPVIDWHFRFQRPQQLAAELGRQGYRVFYLTMGLLDPAEGRRYLLSESPSQNVFIVSLACPPPHPSPYKQAPTPDQADALREALEHLRRDCRLRTVISIVDLPFWRDVVCPWRGNFSVYDCMDYHAGFLNNEQGMLAEEDRLIQQADLVITTSAGLQNLLKRLRESVLIRNACDIEHFLNAPPEIVRVADGPVVGYFGAVSHWYDARLVEFCARRHPTWTFALIGSTHGCDTERLRSLSNVRLIGELAYEELPRYAHGFDVCMIPFLLTDLIRYTNPVKLYEYLAMGKPVVATAMPEVVLVEQQEPGLVHVGVDDSAFDEALSRALDEADDAALSRRRMAWAKRQTWHNRSQDLLQAVSTRLPLVSVVVLTYNNLELTKRCLSSLLELSRYPNLELIVVDNASEDGSRPWLSEWQQRNPKATLVLNDSNVGFSAGNNIGLGRANGEFLVILNNDTHVTPGWIGDLLRHFRKDEKLGLLGPVTNNIGNEAKIEISYDNMQQMQDRSRTYVERHRGHAFDVKAAAFFCVMIRREVYLSVGPLDEGFGIGMFEDDDYCNRVRQAGWAVRIADDVFIHHELSASFNQMPSETRSALFDSNRKAYEGKWGPWVPHRYRHPMPKI